MFGHFLLLTVILFTISVSNCEENYKSPSPVILIPGYGGSILYAKLRKTNKTNCDKEDGGYRIFMDSAKIQLNTSCWIENMQLKYDNKTKKTRNQDGVFVRVPYWGETKSVESLDIHETDNWKFFTSITKSLVDRLDYQRDVSIRAAPYDFRKGPDELEDFFQQLKYLVEDTYKLNNNTPVTFIAFSLGGKMTLIFLQQQSREWKQKYIKTFITLGTPWFGSLSFLKNLLEGGRAGLNFIDLLQIRTMVRTFPSVSFLVPFGPVWKDFITTPYKAYNREDMTIFFEEIGLPRVSDFLTNMETYRENFTAPGVDVHCLYGTGLFSQVKRFRFKSHIHPEAEYEKDFGDGDGTVNIESLKGCELWNEAQTEEVIIKSFPGVNHLRTLHDMEIIEHILNVLADGRPVEPPKEP